MKNVTVSIDEGTYRLVRLRAADLGTSVSALVRDSLGMLAVGQAQGARAEAEAERRGRLLKEVIADFDARGVGLRMADNLSREQMYARDAGRAETEDAETGRGRRTSASPRSAV